MINGVQSKEDSAAAHKRHLPFIIQLEYIKAIYQREAKGLSTEPTPLGRTVLMPSCF